MNTHRKVAATAAAVVLGVAPAVALAHGPGGNHGKSQNAPGITRAAGTTGTSGTSTTGSSPSNTRAYGRLCQTESRKHVTRQSGTPFSTCVKDMAQAANSTHPNPHQICANESKRHVAGMSGTPYSQCVVAAAKLRGQQESQGSGDSGSGTTTTTSTDTTSTSTTSTSGS